MIAITIGCWDLDGIISFSRERKIVKVGLHAKRRSHVLRVRLPLRQSSGRGSVLYQRRSVGCSNSNPSSSDRFQHGLGALLSLTRSFEDPCSWSFRLNESIHIHDCDENCRRCDSSPARRTRNAVSSWLTSRPLTAFWMIREVFDCRSCQKYILTSESHIDALEGGLRLR